MEEKKEKIFATERCFSSLQCLLNSGASFCLPKFSDVINEIKKKKREGKNERKWEERKKNKSYAVFFSVSLIHLLCDC